MNRVVKEALKEDLHYTFSMIIYIIVIMVILRCLMMSGGSNDGDGNPFFYEYISIFGMFVTNAYCCSKAKMDRYFSMGFSRKVYVQQAITLGLCRCLVMAAAYTVVGFIGNLICDMQGMAGMIGRAIRMGNVLPPVVQFLFLFLIGLLVNHHMLMDSVMKQPRFSASVYLTSPSIWSFNNNKKAKKRSGKQMYYMLLIVVYVFAAIMVSFLMQWFYTNWLAAVILCAMAVLNAVFLIVFLKKASQVDII